jgi:molybdenum-dependent DNA-binding transcriptional regulator ModE
MVTPVIRFRIDFAANSWVGPGKIELLEAIRRHGSLSQAARSLGMSYRRAWLLVESSYHELSRDIAIAAARRLPSIARVVVKDSKSNTKSPRPLARKY